MSQQKKPELNLNWLELTYLNNILKNRNSWHDNASWVQIQVVEELICKIDDVQNEQRMRFTIDWEHDKK